MITVALNLDPCPCCGRVTTINDGEFERLTYLIEFQCLHCRLFMSRKVSMASVGHTALITAVALEMAEVWNTRV